MQTSTTGTQEQLETSAPKIIDWLKPYGIYHEFGDAGNLSTWV